MAIYYYENFELMVF